VGSKAALVLNDPDDNTYSGNVPEDIYYEE
jgi:hypothetical protein